MSRANDINDEGLIVGIAMTQSGAHHAFLWTPSQFNGTTGIMIDLTPAAQFAEAWAVNSRGEVVGQIETAQGVRAFLWSRSGGLVDLGTLPGGSNSTALGIDRTGRAVGMAIGNVWRPVVWSKG
jgi:probable HAF family extracellular repeat protein